ncbi:MAG: Gfo/Idh/MocA family oxidoreductase [Chloroflexi bacterium]|nr:Gfo/Idh/MocA family oxidoreductase [Chloroflexota bacterium]
MVLRIGTLGAAWITPSALIDPAAGRDDVEVRCIAARDRGRAEAFAKEHGIPTVHDGYADVVEDPEIDAVYNALQISGHKEWTIRALEAGKHVLCEKPFAMNEAEAREMADAARRSGRVCIEAFHYYYHPVGRRMREIVQSGQLGAIRSASATFCTGIEDTPSSIRHQIELGGGATMDLGCYPLHYLRHIFGAEPEVLSARAETVRGQIDISMEADLRFPGGVPAHISTGMIPGTWFTSWVHVVGDEGTLLVDQPLVPQNGNRIEIATAAGTTVETLERTPTFVFQLEAFVRAIAGGAPMPTDADDGVISMRVIDAVYRAAGLSPRGEV